MTTKLTVLVSGATGHQVNYEVLPVSVVEQQSNDMATMFEWLYRVGYNVDIPELHRKFSDVDWQSYSQWADSQDWRFLKQES